MDLFDNTPYKNRLPYDGELIYYGPLIPLAEANVYLEKLLASIVWQNDEALIYGKHIVTKRKVAWYADKNFSYTYSNTTKIALPWTKELLSLKALVEQYCNTRFNSCLLNLYHNGEEGVSWHSDDEKALGKDITCRVHSIEEYENAVKASEILFKKGQEAVEGLRAMTGDLIKDVFEGVPQATFAKEDLSNGIDIVSAFVEKGGFLKSNGEARRELKQNSISVNKEKVTDTKVLTEDDLIGGKYILLQKGKKNNYLITVE